MGYPRVFNTQTSVPQKPVHTSDQRRLEKDPGLVQTSPLLTRTQKSPGGDSIITGETPDLTCVVVWWGTPQTIGPLWFR